MCNFLAQSVRALEGTENSLVLVNFQVKLGCQLCQSFKNKAKMLQYIKVAVDAMLSTG
jgi:hypothetical protein